MNLEKMCCMVLFNLVISSVLLIPLNNNIGLAHTMPHFKSLVMRNLQYDLCNNLPKHHKATLVRGITLNTAHLGSILNFAM